MAFPHTYKNKIELLNNKVKGNRLNSVIIKKLISNEISSFSPEEFLEKDKFITFTSISKLFRYEYKIKLYIEKKGNDYNIIYEIDLEKVLRIIIIGIILIAFFSFLSVKYFLISAGLYSLLFYILNVLIISTSVENLIKRAIGENNYTFNDSEVISPEQEQWIKDENRCPACGEFVTNIDLNCSECGLRIKRNRYSIPLDLSKHKEKKIKYHYKKKGSSD